MRCITGTYLVYNCLEKKLKKKPMKNFVEIFLPLSLHSFQRKTPVKREKREFSSAGSEHLPYKQRVGGSNPSTPTECLTEMWGFFIWVVDALFK
jgi:hypothetical protein